MEPTSHSYTPRIFRREDSSFQDVGNLGPWPQKKTPKTLLSPCKTPGSRSYLIHPRRSPCSLPIQVPDLPHSGEALAFSQSTNPVEPIHSVCNTLGHLYTCSPNPTKLSYIHNHPSYPKPNYILSSPSRVPVTNWCGFCG